MQFIANSKEREYDFNENLNDDEQPSASAAATQNSSNAGDSTNNEAHVKVPEEVLKYYDSGDLETFLKCSDFSKLALFNCTSLIDRCLEFKQQIASESGMQKIAEIVRKNDYQLRSLLNNSGFSTMVAIVVFDEAQMLCNMQFFTTFLDFIALMGTSAAMLGECLGRASMIFSPQVTILIADIFSNFIAILLLLEQNREDIMVNDFYSYFDLLLKYFQALCSLK